MKDLDFESKMRSTPSPSHHKLVMENFESKLEGFGENILTPFWGTSFQNSILSNVYIQ